MELTKEVLKFIYQSETEDAVLVLENCLDFTLSSRSEQGIISVNLKAKETTIKAVKDIIAAHGLEGLEAKETIKKINREIKSLIFSKKVIHSGNTSDKPISEPPPLSTPTGGGDTPKKTNPFEHIESNPYLSLTEKECLLCVFDPAYKTTTIADLPDKARRHYFRLAGAKLRMLKMLDVAI